MVVTVLPATATAWKTIAYSGLLGAIRPIVLPSNPLATSPPANRCTAVDSSAKVWTRPVAPSIMAGRSG